MARTDLSGDQERHRAVTIGKFADHRRDDNHQRRDRQQHQTGDVRNFIADGLQVERRHEAADGDEAAERQSHHATGEKLRVPQQLEVDDRRSDAPLDSDENAEQDQGRCSGRQGGRRIPAPVVAFHDRRHQRRHPRHQKSETQPVDPFVRQARGLFDRPPGDGEAEDDHGHVDVERPPPGQRRQKQAAQHRPDRHAEAGDAHEYRQRSPLLVFGKVMVHQADRAGQHDRPGDALSEPAGDEELRIVGRSGQERRQRKDDHANVEHAPSAVDVAEPPHRDHEYRQHQEEGVHYPLQLVNAGVKFPLDTGKDGVDDGEVDEDDEAEDADPRQGQPPLPGFTSHPSPPLRAAGVAPLFAHRVRRQGGTP